MGTATTTYRPLEEWSNEELVFFEETVLNDRFASRDVLEEGGSPNVADWIEYHARTVDRLLNEAGIRMIEKPSSIKDDPFGKTRRHRDFDALYGPQDRSHLKIVNGTGDSHV